MATELQCQGQLHCLIFPEKGCGHLAHTTGGLWPNQNFSQPLYDIIMVIQIVVAYGGPSRLGL
jgi:hypothetical protein